MKPSNGRAVVSTSALEALWKWASSGDVPAECADAGRELVAVRAAMARTGAASKPLSHSQQVVLDAITAAYRVSGEPIIRADVVTLSGVRERHLTNIIAALVDRGLLVVPALGVSAYTPASVPKRPFPEREKVGGGAGTCDVQECQGAVSWVGFFLGGERGATCDAHQERMPSRSRVASPHVLDVLRQALRPFARYIEARQAKPLRGLGDVIHAIHTGDEHAAEITVQDCDAARVALNTLAGGEARS